MAIPDKSKYINRILHSDIEARGFLDIIKTDKDVWCVVSRDDETDELFVFHDYPEFDNAKVMDEGVEHIIPPRTGTLIEGVRFWYLAGKNGSKLSVHNAATYDLPLVKKIWPKCEIPDDVWVDTFVKSKIQYFDRPQKKGAKSPHGLLNYSLMEGNKKPTVEDFTLMNAFMLHRCIVDTKTQKYCYNYLKRESDKLKEALGISFDGAYEMEFAYAKTCHTQETYGAKVDIEHIHKCIKYLDETTEELAAEIEPQLPPTCKVNSAKITRSDLMQKLEWQGKIPPDEMESYVEDGVTLFKPVKPYYSPSTNFHRVEKQKYYSGFNLSYGESPEFKKKNELTGWIKENHPDTKSKEWDIGFVEKETKLLNKNTCDYFGVEEGDTDYIAGAHTRITFTPSTMTQHEVTKGFLIREGIKWAEEWNFKKDSAKQMVKATHDMVVSYPPKAAPEHQIHYKIKKGEPIVTSPKFGEKEYEQLDTEIGKKIGLYNTLVHRRRYLSNPKDPDNKGLLSYIREDGRIPAGLNNFGTATGRGAQRVIVNLPSDGSVFGKEMRQCIIASEGKELVGIDQKSSQLSICALVTNNTSYYNAVATGVEFENNEDGSTNYVGSSAHCVNSRYFNLVTEADWLEAVHSQHEELIHTIVLARKKSKGLSFASLFGCSFKKLAIMGSFSEADAKVKLKSFLDGMGLTPVIAFLEQCKIKYKRGSGFYIPTGFGYWVYCKSIHAAVNYLIQSLEGVVQKKAILLFEQKLITSGLVGKAHKILDVHDEILIECDKGLGVQVGLLACAAYTEAGILLTEWYLDNLHLFPAGCTPEVVCDFAGGYAVGENYGECH
jgi:hypothetical protein